MKKFFGRLTFRNILISHLILLAQAKKSDALDILYNLLFNCRNISIYQITNKD